MALRPIRPTAARRSRARRHRPSELLAATRDFGLALSAFFVFPFLPLLLTLLMRAYAFAPGLEAVKPPPLHMAAQTNQVAPATACSARLKHKYPPLMWHRSASGIFAQLN
mmetsp:Transcript_23095/g.70728  ORF Transcript_23095/g.70728 Transcript_23095/m.70728 type:complete len:110 (-) Transcript_23095:948-1277(-)